MKTISCDKTHEYLAGYREGWLDFDLSEKVRLHLQRCKRCELELKRDVALTSAIESLPERSVAPAQWESVYVSKKNVYRNNSFNGKRRLAYALSLCCVLFILSVLFEHMDETVKDVPKNNSIQLGVMAPANSGMRSYMGVDAVLSAADASSDPNRAVMLLYESKNR